MTTDTEMLARRIDVLTDTVRYLTTLVGARLTREQLCERLGIHRNTLGYRLRQIRQVLTADLDAPNTRLTLHLALIAHRLIGG